MVADRLIWLRSEMCSPAMHGETRALLDRSGTLEASEQRKYGRSPRETA